jgi:hypothetical protein
MADLSIMKARAGSNSVRVELVDNQEKLTHALAIRAICFLEEEGLNVGLALDANDFHATHVIVYSGAEPIGALRIRWFKDFAKIERSGMRKAYRSPRNIKMAGDFAFDHIARKGFTRVITHAKPRYAKLWKALMGFRESGKPPATYHGHPEPYIELIRDLEPPNDAIGIETAANVLFRVEGRWDSASDLE